MRTERALAAGLAAVLAAVPAASGEEAAPEVPAVVEVELNKLEPRGDGCQAWLVARNPGPVAHQSLRLDVVLFGADGVIATRLAVEIGPLPADKTLVKAFVVEGVACDSIGAALLNDVLSCGGDAPCLDAVRPVGRAPLIFTR